MIKIATEHDIYSVIEGNDLEVCVIVLSESVSAEFEVTAHLDYKCKSLSQVAILKYVIIMLVTSFNSVVISLI